MLEKFVPFHLSEEELKERIYLRIKHLNEISPNEWGKTLLDLANPQNSSEEIIVNLVDNIATLAELRPILNEMSIGHLLITINKIIDLEINKINLHFGLTQRLFLNAGTVFYGIRAGVALEIMERHAPDLVPNDFEPAIDILANPYATNRNLEEIVKANNAVDLGISKLAERQDLYDYFSDCIKYLDFQIEEYIQKHVMDFVNEFHFRMLFEVVTKSTEIISDIFQDNQLVISPTKIRPLIEVAVKKVKQDTNRRFGFTRGGIRKKRGFYWNDEKKIAFYHAVEALPKIKPKSRTGEKPEVSFWVYAFERLIEDEFDNLTLARLKKLGTSIDISEALFEKAVKAWRKYLHNENWDEMREDEKPRAFEYLHALHSLNYPPETSYFSLKTYYYRGRKLFENQSSL